MDKLVQGRAQSRISLAEFMKMSTQVNEKVMATEKALQEAEQQNSAEEQLQLMQNHCTVQCEREGAGADAQIRVGKIVQEPPE